MNDDLVRYVSGILESSREEDFEQRLFEDSALARDVCQLFAVRDALRALCAQGPVVPVVRAAEFAALALTMRVTEHHPVGGHVVTRIGDEEFVAAHVPFSGADVSRVHVLFCTPAGVPYFRVNEAPFDRGASEVVVFCKRHVAIAAGTLIVRVVDDDERVLGEVSIANVA